MKSLLQKVKDFTQNLISTTVNKINYKLNKPIKSIIVGFLAILVILVMSFYAAWVYLFYQGKAMLGDLLNLIDRVISPQMVAFITFISTCFVDEDNNGIPDRFDKEENNETNHTRNLEDNRPKSQRRD